ncbi:hypothetical protein LUR56_36770 [Streptomyces sp. MT29]|nr:hypothetical protein [Streptomyces sp. MT29]
MLTAPALSAAYASGLLLWFTTPRAPAWPRGWPRPDAWPSPTTWRSAW